VPSPVLFDVLVICAVAVAVGYLCHRLRVPEIVGFLATGAVAGPHALGLVRNVHEVEALAEIGVALLLFTIGLEFSRERLRQLRHAVFRGGLLQVALTVAAGAGLVLACGVAWRTAVFAGFLLALSSTAIVLRALQARRELATAHGRASLGMLLFQDLMIVPMLLAVPLLAGAEVPTGGAIAVRVAAAMAILGAVVAGSGWLVPRLLHRIARTRSRELFLLAVIVVALGVAWLLTYAGISLALGAFLAGFLLAESEFRHQALGQILPFRDVFTSFFFVSAGMLLDPGFVAASAPTVAGLVLAVLLLKSAIAAGTALATGLALRPALLAGLAVAQVGEFSFVLSRSGLEAGLLDPAQTRLFVAVSVLSMVLTPPIIALAPRTAALALRLPGSRRLAGRSASATDGDPAELSNHMIVIGLGLNGRNLTRAARGAGIPYVVIELDADIAASARRAGEPVIFGDGAEATILERAAVGAARIAVVAVSDVEATRRIVSTARALAPGVHILARTRHVEELHRLCELGADAVIPEEFETSIEIFTRALRHYLVPEDEIERFTAEVRAGGYEMLTTARRPTDRAAALGSLLVEAGVGTLRVGAGSPLVGRSLVESGLRARCGVSVLAIRRAGGVITNPGGDTVLAIGDALVLLGDGGQFAAAAAWLGGAQADAADATQTAAPTRA